MREELALSLADAETHMWNVHTKGSALVATLLRHEAMAAVNRVLERARAAGHPLRVRASTR